MTQETLKPISLDEEQQDLVAMLPEVVGRDDREAWTELATQSLGEHATTLLLQQDTKRRIEGAMATYAKPTR